MECVSRNTRRHQTSRTPFGLGGKVPGVDRIIKSGNRTIVFWKDGTKTIVKRAEDEADNDYAAFTAALGIKLYGSNSALKRVVSKVQVQKSKREHERA